jgi:hypothetical protein
MASRKYDAHYAERFTAILTIRPEHFASYSFLFTLEYEVQIYVGRFERPGRKRAPGAGRPFRDDHRLHFLMWLLWFVYHPPCAVIGELFEMSESNVRRTLKRCEAVMDHIRANKEFLNNWSYMINHLDDLDTSRLYAYARTVDFQPLKREMTYLLSNFFAQFGAGVPREVIAEILGFAPLST